MKRDPRTLVGTVFDVVVIGGGIYGAAIAREAVLRGLSVALVERGDFGGATSANSQRIVHGGLRYLQHADLRRVRESIRERRALARIAPHLVRPLPVLIPTYGHGLRGKEILTLALKVHRWVGLDGAHEDRSREADPPEGTVSRSTVLDWFPGIDSRGLTGGVVFHDAQVESTERLLLSVLHSAAGAGARIVNYVEAVGFLREGRRVSGVVVRDVPTDERFEVRARTVVNAAGPWIGKVEGLPGGPGSRGGLRFARALNLVTRPVVSRCALGFYSRRGYRDRDAVLSRGSRLLFATPQRSGSIIGTSLVPYGGDPEGSRPTESEIQDLFQEIREAAPFFDLEPQDVRFVHEGLLPSSGVDPRSGDVQVAKRYRLDDHRNRGVEGFLSVLGVKYTTARDVAEKAIDRVLSLRGLKAPRSVSAEVPLWGGAFEDPGELLAAAVAEPPGGLDESLSRRLVGSYGAAWTEVLRLMDRTEGPPGEIDVLRAEVRYAAREEMARTVGDVVFRRIEMGSAGHPGREALDTIAAALAEELGWSEEQTEREIAEVEERFAPFEGV